MSLNSVKIWKRYKRTAPSESDRNSSSLSRVFRNQFPYSFIVPIVRLFTKCTRFLGKRRLSPSSKVVYEFQKDIHRTFYLLRPSVSIPNIQKMSREYYNLKFVVTTPTLYVTEYNCLNEPCNQVHNSGSSNNYLANGSQTSKLIRYCLHNSPSSMLTTLERFQAEEIYGK